jgi:predicted 2-oxoglutarate/Fe(II)-dependent dioxygenase YbiX
MDQHVFDYFVDEYATKYAEKHVEHPDRDRITRDIETTLEVSDPVDSYDDDELRAIVDAVFAAWHRLR